MLCSPTASTTATSCALTARRVEAFPRRGPGLDALDLWNGPEPMFARAGFQVVRDDLVRPVLRLEL